MYTVISKAARKHIAYPDQIVSSEDPISSGSTLFSNEDISGFSRPKHSRAMLNMAYAIYTIVCIRRLLMSR